MSIASRVNIIALALLFVCSTAIRAGDAGGSIIAIDAVNELRTAAAGGDPGAMLRMGSVAQASVDAAGTDGTVSTGVQKVHPLARPLRSSLCSRRWRDVALSIARLKLFARLPAAEPVRMRSCFPLLRGLKAGTTSAR